MIEALLIFIILELGMRILPLLDSITELINHYIAIGVQKCDCKIRKIAIESEKAEMELNNGPTHTIGFCAPEEPQGDEIDDCSEN